MKLRDTATLSAKFQISIPKAVRTARRLRPGQVFAFIPKGEGLLLVPVPKREEFAGFVRGANPAGYRDRDDRAYCGWSIRLPGSSGWSPRRSGAPSRSRRALQRRGGQPRARRRPATSSS